MQAALKKEQPLSIFIPYSNHVTENVIKTHEGDYVISLRLQGAPHESADINDLNAWQDQLNSFLRNIASPHISVWSHIVRRKFDRYPEGQFKNEFAKKLNEKYKQNMLSNELFVNELYLTLVYRPQPNKAISILSRFGMKSKSNEIEEQKEAIEFIEEHANTALTALARYAPKKLGLYTFKDTLFSEPLQLYSFLIDGEWHRFPMPKNTISEVLATSRPYFGKAGSIAIKTPINSHHAAILAIQEYPAITYGGILNDLLSIPYQLVVSQSFTFISKQAAIGRMTRQKDRMIAAGDVAISQINDIESALDDLVSNNFVMGSHHLSIVIRASEVKKLSAAITATGAILSDVGMKWAREDLGASSAYWAQLPANFKYRPRLSDITSRNFAGFSSFHNFPIGRINGNQWGDAVMMFKTTSQSPYFFNFHRTEVINNKIDKNHRDLANTMVIGKSGGGKTVLEMMMLAQATKFDQDNDPATFILFDKDLGASIGVRALGGKYYPLKKGLPSGFSPLKLEATKENIAFLDKFVRKLVYRPDMPLSPAQEKELIDALHGVMDQPVKDRSLALLLQYLDPTDPSGISARLTKWCSHGANGWLFDNEQDDFTLTGSNIYAFDVTEFIEDDELNVLVSMYLFHKIEALIDGRRIAIFMDELWKLLVDDYFEDLIENKLKTIRKQNGFLVTFTQSPKDTLRSKISHSLIEQTATKIFLTNPDASREDYVDGFKLTNREFELVKSFGEHSRKCLIKQGENSVVVELDLKGFEDELAVLSSNTATANLVEGLVQELGDNPADWLPEFHKQR